MHTSSLSENTITKLHMERFRWTGKFHANRNTEGKKNAINHEISHRFIDFPSMQLFSLSSFSSSPRVSSNKKSKRRASEEGKLMKVHSSHKYEILRRKVIHLIDFPGWLHDSQTARRQRVRRKWRLKVLRMFSVSTLTRSLLPRRWRKEVNRMMKIRKSEWELRA